MNLYEEGLVQQTTDKDGNDRIKLSASSAKIPWRISLRCINKDEKCSKLMNIDKILELL